MDDRRRVSKFDAGGDERLVGFLDGGVEALLVVPRLIGVFNPSKSRAFRFGEWFATGDPPPRCSATKLDPVFRERLLDNEVVPLFPPDRVFAGIGRAGDLGAEGLPLGLALPPLFLRSKEGVVLTRAPPLVFGDRLSKTALISDGIAIWWILLTARQSAAWMLRDSC